jgi:hypothetical protein
MGEDVGGAREMISRRGHERGKGEMFWHMQERYRVKHQEERRKKKIEKKRKKKNRVVRQGKANEELYRNEGRENGEWRCGIPRAM